MNNINLNQFLQTTILENTTIEPNEFKITFAELICGEDSKTYKQQFINYLKSPKKSNLKNKQTKEIFIKTSEENKKLAQKFDLLIQHLTILQTAIHNFDHSFNINNMGEKTQTSTKKAQILLYWILEQFITWKQKPHFNNVEEVKFSLIYFINRVKPEIDNYIREMALHACNPERFTNINDIQKFKKVSSRTFALA